METRPFFNDEDVTLDMTIVLPDIPYLTFPTVR